MPAASYDIVVEEGATWTRVFTITDSGVPRNITGCTIALKAWTSDKILVIDLSVGAGITLTTPASGVFTAVITAAATEALEPSRLSYVLEITDTAAAVERIFKGIITVSSRYQA